MYCIKADSEDIQKYLESEVLNTADSNLIKKVVGQEELESSTSAVSERHSNQLNY